MRCWDFRTEGYSMFKFCVSLGGNEKCRVARSKHVRGRGGEKRQETSRRGSWRDTRLDLDCRGDAIGTTKMRGPSKPLILDASFAKIFRV